jgi:hypothetical protein
MATAGIEVGSSAQDARQSPDPRAGAADAQCQLTELAPVLAPLELKQLADFGYLYAPVVGKKLHFFDLLLN